MSATLGRLLLAMLVCTALANQKGIGEPKNPADLSLEIITTDITCPDCTTVRMVGVLGPEAPGQLSAFLSENNVPEGANLDLSSPGGLLSSGVEVGELIRAYPLRTSIGKPPTNSPSYCASACAFAYFGGVERVVYDQGKLGLHQFYGGETNAYTESITQFIVGDLLEYTERMGVNAGAIREAAQTPPEEMTWLTGQQLEQYGIVTGEADESGLSWQLKSDTLGDAKKGSTTPSMVGSSVQSNGQVANFEIGCPRSPFSKSDRVLADQRMRRMLYLSGGRLPAEITDGGIPDSMSDWEAYFSLSFKLSMGLLDQSKGRLMPILIHLHGQPAKSLGELCGLDGCEFPSAFMFDDTDDERLRGGIHDVLGENSLTVLFDVMKELNGNGTAVGGFDPGWYPFTERVFRNRKVFVTYIDIDDMRRIAEEPPTRVKLELEPIQGRFLVGEQFVDELQPPTSELLFPSFARGVKFDVFLEICESKAPDRVKSNRYHLYDYLDSSDDPKRPLPRSPARRKNSPTK